ncbi:GIY-YIG nuclease family protein [Lelliottia sp. V106_10]|uniref:GIY-YIG nuclease family protein n=1 Tax=Enterobacteriaceae TaxID=543 RepID=UPI0010703718|nr:MULTISPECIES: GIY-YIG nuclease family protein [Enterobacteriaceae]MBM1023136.1 GIY-YIG nuclease family protein [Enterobacter sp. E1]MDK9373490.1 GIY-YIG nuclease family protein [Lelliottia sp. V106_10]MDK9600469.1 GIY-YIG nuclease family protein [Lelliottia sp. V106_5]MEA3564457.1 GIY-YIG nuclease family protein [Enterobacter sp. GM-22]MEA3598132.1 GIY-YIG nuclease family protein [Enterobacter sp. GM-31]
MLRLSPVQPRQKATIDDIFSEADDLGLLVVEPLKIYSPTGNLSVSRLEEINAFYVVHGHPPLTDSEEFKETLLAQRLRALRDNKQYHEMLQPFDIHGLLEGGNTGNILEPSESLPVPPVVVDKSELVTSLEDIFADDDDGLLSFSAPDIFTLKHVPTEKKTQPDEIAKRQPCPDFHRFAPLFETVQNGLKTGAFSFVRFRHELKIYEGDFFILNGVMGYVDKVGERLEEYGPWNARLHLVFENGTEMNMLFLSLTHGLVRDTEGRKIILNGQHVRPDETPVPTGYVYVLATHSNQPALQCFKPDLYKIGFTEGTIEERIKHAEKDKTFLEAPVRIVMTTQCFNINTHKLEALIHGFLGKQRLNITLRGLDGQIYHPREWFHAPLATVLSVIKYILDGTISQYRMDNTTGKIVAKQDDKHQ